MLIFILIGLSGVLISKTILITLSMSSLWLKTIHLFFSGLALILLGIHIGLHLCRKEMYKGFAIVLSVISLCLGLYGFKDTQMQRWLTMPLTGQVLHVEENGLHLQGVQNGKGKGYGKGLHLGGGYEDNKEVLSLNQKLVLYSEFFGLMFTGTMATYWLVRINKTINSLSEKH
ncbi:MAG: hypothetical protein Q4B60_06110 [Erysipelotrichaceae bacterium]|nr:hypothetical protein [Erysipelotrichaceae bacterium]